MSKELKEKLEILRKSQDNILADFGVKKIGVFGSFAKGKQTKKSDIDILVEFDKKQKMGFFRFIELEDELVKILKCKVDLVTKKALKPIMKQEVLKEVIYA